MKLSEYIRLVRTTPDMKEFLDLLWAEPPHVLSDRQSIRWMLTHLGTQVRDQHGGSGIASAIIEQQIWKHGPKVIQLGQLAAEALENTMPTIEWSDYRQPYPSMLIELPYNYQHNKQTVCPQAQEFDDLPSRHYPTFCKLYFDPEQQLLIASVVFSSGQSIEQMMWQKPENPTIESGISEAGMGQFDGSQESSGEERRITNDIIRLSVNACMLVTGEPTPEKEAQLLNLKRKERVARERKQNLRASELRYQIRHHPMIYEIDQTIHLFDRSTTSAEASDEAVGFKRPHWRRGHWRQQACGSALRERRAVFVRPVLVNGRMFGGRAVDTTTTYVVGNEDRV